MKPNFSFNFELQAFDLKINFSCDSHIDNRCRITLYDTVYKSILYSYYIDDILLGVNYYFLPPTTCVYACSKNLTLKIEDKNDQVIFTESFKIADNIDLTLLDKFPDILKYKSVNLTLISQIFLLKMYEAFNLFVEEGDVVVDIGANYGIFTYFAFYKKPSKIYVCEPNNDLFVILKDHFSNYKNVYLDNCAISKNNGFADFTLVDPESDNCDGQRNHLNSYAETIEMLRHDSFKIVKTKTKSFIEFILSNNISKINFLKVDCEGGEYDIFTEENAYYIKNYVDKVIVEYHNYPDSIVEFANKNNFIILNDYKKNSPCELLFLKNKNEPCK